MSEQTLDTKLENTIEVFRFIVYNILNLISELLL